MNAVIMAGGKGTRIAGVCGDRPKPMIEVCGKPILEMQIQNLVSCGICNITIAIGYMGQVIRDYFGNGEKWNAHITYYEEDAARPLGSAGALFCIEVESKIGDAFILMCGDLVLDIDFSRLIAFHESKNDALASIMVHPNNHPYDSALVETQEVLTEAGGIPQDTGRVTSWLGRKRDNTSTASASDGTAPYHRNLVNSGVMIVTRELLDITRLRLAQTVIEGKTHRNTANEDAPGTLPPPLPSPSSEGGSLPYPIDIDRDVLRPAVPSGRIYALHTTEYICDMGTPERYKKVVHDVSCGIAAARNIKRLQRAVFLDRDDTIVRDAHFMKNASQLELLPGAAEAIRRINESGYLAVVVTNQPVIARGDASWEDLREIHNKLETLLGAQGAYLDGIYVCPHHSDKGFAGERVEYKRVCDCRKPKPGLILAAARELNIDVSNSIMIGDREKDTECGRRAGCKKNIQLHEGYTLLDAVSAFLG